MFSPLSPYTAHLTASAGPYAHHHSLTGIDFNIHAPSQKKKRKEK